MRRIDSFNQFVGEKVPWLNLVMVLLTFLIVVFRYAFGLSWVWLQELVLYMHAAVFMSAVGFSLKENEHVKVDICYVKMSSKQQAWVHVFGVLVFLFPFCALMAFHSAPYVFQSWKIFEGSGDANGLKGVFLLKTLLLIYPFLLSLQWLSLLLSSAKEIRCVRG